jgi:endonuclease YncB( thermonuclease family)
MLRPAAALCSLAFLVPTVPAAYAEPSPVQQPESPWRNVQAWETAVVQRVVDGDTVIVNDEVTGAQSRIRLLGINSPEKPTAKKPGNCGGAQATEWLTALLPEGTRVRLLSSDRASTGKAQRPQRVVLAYNPATGEFDQDVAWGMAERGWGLWFTLAKEASMSSLYRAAIEGAQQRRVGMWNPELCGSIEQPDASLALRISRGNGDVTDETVTVRNSGGSTVDITGWMLRDAGNAGWYTFPGGSVLAPGDYRVVHTGKGKDRKPTGHDVYRNRASELYVDPGREPNLVGDGAYLLDKAGNFRSWREYPCTQRCEPDEGAGTLVIEDLSLGKKRGKKRAQTQFIRITNKGSAPLCLDGYRMQTEGLTYWFPSGTCLAPSARLTLHGGNKRSWSEATYLNRSKPMFYINGSAQLVSDRDQVLAERFW